VPLKRQWELVDAFLAAAREGNIEALVRVLDPDVIARADAGPGPSPIGRSRGIHGVGEVARQALAFRGMAGGARRALINGSAGLVVFSNGRPYAVLAMTFSSEAITEIDILADPVRLARHDLTAIEPAD
jgi:RNA polymerase sigma-70 factor (ECF subfamily)